MESRCTAVNMKKATPSRSAERVTNYGQQRRMRKCSGHRVRFLSEGELLLADNCSNENEIYNSSVDKAERHKLHNATELRIRGGGKVAQAAHESRAAFIDLPVSNGDTLTSIALRYNCTIPALMRQNKLMTDQDLFGLQTIRVPVLKHGVVEERIETENLGRISTSEYPSAMSSEMRNTNDEMSSASDTDNDLDESSTSLRRPLLRSTSFSAGGPAKPIVESTNRSGQSSECAQVEQIFRSIDKDVRIISAAMGVDSKGVDGVSIPIGSVEQNQPHSTNHLGMNTRTLVVILVFIGGVITIVFIGVLRQFVLGKL